MDRVYSCDSEKLTVDEFQNLLAKDAAELSGTYILEDSLNEIKHGTKKLAEIAVYCCNENNDSEALHRYSDLFFTFFKTAEKSKHVSNALHKKIYDSLDNIFDFYENKAVTIIHRYSKLLEATLSRIKSSMEGHLHKFIENLEFDLTTKEGAKQLYLDFKGYDLMSDLVYNKKITD